MCGLLEKKKLIRPNLACGRVPGTVCSVCVCVNAWLYWLFFFSLLRPCEHGIQVDPSKIDKVKDFPTPTSVRSFVGLASYYHRRFVPHFAAIAAPLQHRTRIRSND